MISSRSLAGLVKKYDVPVPRYTSYPTMPYWNTGAFDTTQWISAVERSFTESNGTKGMSVYIHLPFCESLCTYCACNTRITKNHNVETGYIQTLLKEWEMYKNIFGSVPRIRELHLGGGTPTFFSPENLKWLVNFLLEGALLHRDFEFSFEGHPNNTTAEHMKTLYSLGFRRLSFGVQDLNEKVQQTINRIQPLESLENVTAISREIGYNSIGFDLVYGLPFQTTGTVTETIQKILKLKPDRVSYYSYAHVPWVRPGQRGYEDADLPSVMLKRNLYEIGRTMLKSEGYEDVGMDHFALRHDSLFKAQACGKLHRNFMGYTTSETDLLIGLGTSAISDAKYAYSQNLKKVEDYTTAIATNRLAVFKGHMQTPQDLLLKQCILDVACKGTIRQESLVKINRESVHEKLLTMTDEGILKHNIDGFHVTELGRAFIRNICSVFDFSLSDAESPKSNIFSKAI